MSRRLRFSEDERPPEPSPKKRKRKQQPPEHYTGEPEDAQQTASSGDTPPQGATNESRATPAPAPIHNSHKIEKLEQKSERYKERLSEASDALPTKKKLVRKRIYDEQKGKAKSKLTFESEVVPIGEAK